jgi:hypothetical protein
MAEKKLQATFDAIAARLKTDEDFRRRIAVNAISALDAEGYEVPRDLAENLVIAKAERPGAGDKIASWIFVPGLVMGDF